MLKVIEDERAYVDKLKRAVTSGSKEWFVKVIEEEFKSRRIGEEEIGRAKV